MVLGILNPYYTNLVKGPGELFWWCPLVASLLSLRTLDILSRDNVSAIQSLTLGIFLQNSTDIFPVPQNRRPLKIGHFGAYT